MRHEIYGRDGNGNTVLLSYVEVPDPPKQARWLEMKKDLLNSGAIYTKMRTAANTGSYAGNLISVFAVLDMGIAGHPDESALQTLLNLSGWGFTQTQKDNINAYFINNDFSILIT